jgi:hypothetical protein
MERCLPAAAGRGRRGRNPWSVAKGTMGRLVLHSRGTVGRRRRRKSETFTPETFGVYPGSFRGRKIYNLGQGNDA